MQTLLAFDTDRIKDFVFATTTLQEIRGASSLLDELNRTAMEATICGVDPTARTVYALGGSGMFVVDKDRAEAAIHAVQRRYRQDSGGAASVTAASVDLPDDFDFERTDTRDAYRTVQFRLRQAKDCPPESLAAVSLPFIRPCDAWPEFAAAEKKRGPGVGQERLLSRPCLKMLGTKREVLVERLDLPKGRLPKDFNELGGLSRPDGYLALVYPDGNGLGREVERHASPLSKLQHFGKAVDRALHEALNSAAKLYLQPDGGVLPLVPLLLGGDDMVIVTRAQSALEIAIDLVERFAERTQQSLGRQLTLSVGVVLAHAHFPFRVMLDLAESALKFAKREGATHELNDRGLINFLVVSSSNHVHFEQFYEDVLTAKEEFGARTRRRTARPYTPDGLRTLISAARELSDAPRNKLHALREAVFLPLNRSILEARMTLHRWRGSSNTKRTKHQIDTVMQLFDLCGEGETRFPWHGKDDELRTPLLDLLEIFEFVKERGHVAAAG